MSEALRFAVRVKPRARRDRAGGSWGPERALVVEVKAPAVEGRANEAALAVLADALGVRRSQLAVVSGHRGRSKLIELVDTDGTSADRLDQLRSA